MALMTGAYAARCGWSKGVVGYKIDSNAGMSPEALTLADIYKSEGYATGMSGKWHIGDVGPCRPHVRSFDSAYYIGKSNNQTTKLWRDGELVEDPFSNRMLTDQFTAEAVTFIKVHKHEPFFLYVPYTAPHFPVQAHPDWKGKSAFGVYGDVVEELDSRVGQILATLKAEGIDQNTIVVFMSDNGPEANEQATADPYRGVKWDALEGGNRVPCIISWPGVIPPGQTSNALIASIDLLPTLCQACGIDLSSKTTGSPAIDGVSVWDTLLGKRTPHPRHELLIWHGMQGLHAIRVDDWKLFLSRPGAARHNAKDSPETVALLGEMRKGKGPVLFNLADDVGELKDLSAEFPEKVEELRALAEQRLAEITRNVIPMASCSTSGASSHPVPEDPRWLTYPGGDGPGSGKHIVLIAADQEYRSEQSLPMLARTLSKHHGFHCTVLFSVNSEGLVDPTKKIRWEDESVVHDIPGIEHLKSADLMILFSRLITLPDEQLAYIHEYLDSGKPIVGLRTANHGFIDFRYEVDGQKVHFGNDVLGGSFRGHHGRWHQDSTRGILVRENRDHPVLTGVLDIWGPSDVYRTFEEGGHLPKGCVPLVMGQPLMSRQPDDPPNEALIALPVAWVKSWTGSAGEKARVFHSTMGSAKDFESAGLRRLLFNACYWCLEMETHIRADSSVEILGEYAPLASGFNYSKLGVVPHEIAYYR
jgi:arylsulfatase A-like enzyme/type 1 glutamine amidotransferase